MARIVVLWMLVNWNVVDLCPVITSDLCQCDVDDPVVNCDGVQMFPSMRDPDNSSTVYEILILTKTAIRVIPANAFGNVRFKEIDATGNDIETVDELAFAGTERTLIDLKIRLADSAGFPHGALRILESLKSLTIVNFGQEVLPAGALSNLTSLENLTLSNGNLVSLSPDDLRDQASSLKYLNLFNNGLSNFPSEVVLSLMSLERLKISSNNIRQLPGNAVRSASLHFLDISSQQMLTKVDDQSFDGVAKSLQTLKMTHSRLTDRNAWIFSKLKSLHDLDVSYNNFTNLLPITGSLTSLVYLKATHNHIETISRRVFQTVTLQSIDLSYNTFQSFEPDAFRDLSVLESLSLEHAVGVTLDADSFVGQVSSLKWLTLSYVDMSTPQWAPFRGLGVLENLLLRGCKLGNIPDMTFFDSPLLKTLVIGDNLITELKQKALAQRTVNGARRGLQWIQLDNNQLTTIDRCAFHGLEVPENVVLNNNPLACDCGIRPLFDLAQNNPSFLWQCSDGRRVSFLDPEIFSQCNTSITAEPCLNFTSDITTEPVEPDGTRTDDDFWTSPAAVPLIIAAGVFLSLLLVCVPLVVYNCVTSRRARRRLQLLEETEPTLGSNTKRFMKQSGANPSTDNTLTPGHRLQSRSMEILQTSDTDAVISNLLMTYLRDRPNHAVSLDNLDSIRYHVTPVASRAYIESEIYDEIEDDKLICAPSED